MSDDRVAADQDPSVGNRNLSALVVDDDFNGVFNIYERSKHDVSIYSNIDVGNRYVILSSSFLLKMTQFGGNLKQRFRRYIL